MVEGMYLKAFGSTGSISYKSCLEDQRACQVAADVQGCCAWRLEPGPWYNPFTENYAHPSYGPVAHVVFR